MTRTPATIGILGAGIGGLAVAAALRGFGMEPLLFEQARTFARVGAGIQQSPNALKVHRGLKIEERLRQSAFAPATSLNRDAYSGAVTNDHPLSSQAEARYGAPYLTLHRGDLHAALAALVPVDSIRFGHKLRSLREDGARVQLQFEGGGEAEVDLLIGADGVHSLTREYVVGPTAARFTGRLAYRTTFPASRLSADIGGSRTKWWGRDRHIVIYYVTAARDELYFVTSQPEAADWITAESWSTRGDLGELQTAFADFHPEVRAVLEAAPEVHKWGIFERDPLPRWSRGRVVLLGDACHPMTPYMASGASMALEDAVVLARTLADPATGSPERAFALYEEVRKPRTSAVQAGSSANTWMRDATNPDWLFGYDAWTVPLKPGQGK
jgi:salicylate hydroxylase/6-hydroxynicotinate 3-monooxygenase